MGKTPKDSQFRPFARGDYVCTTWFERDRQNVRLETPNGRVLFEIWDDEVTEAIEDGFLTPPRRPRPSDEGWQPSAVEYAIAIGVLNSDGSVHPRSARRTN
jgi:hypothetical protein